MSRSLSSEAVAARLARLRATYVPEHVNDARQRFAPKAANLQHFARDVALRLKDLRALCELSDHLHRGTFT